MEQRVACISNAWEEAENRKESRSSDASSLHNAPHSPQRGAD